MVKHKRMFAMVLTVCMLISMMSEVSVSANTSYK